MKVQLSSALLLGVACDTVLARRSEEELRFLQSLSIGNSACLDCFDKIDSARDCLRECNQKAYPGDNCCCCCQCNGQVQATLVPGGQVFNFNGNNQCNNNGGGGNNVFQFCKNNQNNNNGFNCKFTNNNHQNNNKWYNDDQYCNCDQQQTWNQNNNNNKNCNGNQDDTRQSDKDRSLLDFCLQDKGPHTVQDIKDLAQCCAFDDNKCDDYFTQVEECLVGCLNPCLVTTAGDWLDCIRDNGANGGCSRQECLDGFLVDEPKDLHLDDNPDLFDLKTLERLVEKINMEDLEDCSLLHEFVQTTCDVGNSCCNKCEGYLGSSIDCLINDIVIPFASGQLNLSIAECPIDTDKCKAEFRRELTEQEAEKFNKVFNLPPRVDASLKGPKPWSKDQDERSLEVSTTNTTFSSEAAAAACQRKMEANILAYNMSVATGKFMQCLMAAGVEALPDQQQTAAQGSMAANVFTLFGVLSSMVLALLV